MGLVFPPKKSLLISLRPFRLGQNKILATGVQIEKKFREHFLVITLQRRATRFPSGLKCCISFQKTKMAS